MNFSTGWNSSGWLHENTSCRVEKTCQTSTSWVKKADVGDPIVALFLLLPLGFPSQFFSCLTPGVGHHHELLLRFLLEGGHLAAAERHLVRPDQLPRRRWWSQLPEVLRPDVPHPGCLALDRHPVHPGKVRHVLSKAGVLNVLLLWSLKLVSVL